MGFLIFHLHLLFSYLMLTALGGPGFLFVYVIDEEAEVVVFLRQHSWGGVESGFPSVLRPEPCNHSASSSPCTSLKILLS